MRNEKTPAKKQGFLGAFDKRGPQCVDALWTLKETNPYVSNAYRENEITIPVFPHMMWGFFLPKLNRITKDKQLLTEDIWSL
ncbi:hypothetical protein OQN31_12165 [Citrobacter freundii]|uniref:hypothetical protein n=1 Tax=Citrobacter freundii TaxID=546 RepID=UPI00224EC161|nr:hypothetical protein [Citrobacter freundii]MCX3157436.1 hypothetical protein [Citrobacter freundii]MCX3161909.1 hypothetical protein [Citrobacter freundii]MDH2706318.1 hypothetical protein [Citrobacter freundii]